MKKLILLLSFFSTISFAQNGEILRGQIEKTLIYDLMGVDTAELTGWVIGCIDHDSMWTFGYGRISKETKVKPDGNTIFEVGGVTKIFTSTVAQLMIKKGTLNENEPINTYLKTEQQFPLGNKITVLQLLTNTSGLPKLTDDQGDKEKSHDQPYENYTEGAFFESLKRLDSTNLKVGKYLYSHLNHAVLEKIITHQNGFYDLQNIESQRFMDTIYPSSQGYNPGQRAVSDWNFKETFKYSNGVKLNAKTILNFLKTQINATDTAQLAVFQDTQKPLFPTEMDKETFVGKAWHVIKHKKRANICLQTGSTNGHSAFVALVPATKTGVIVLTNSRLVQMKMGMLVLKILNDNWRRKDDKF